MIRGMVIFSVYRYDSQSRARKLTSTHLSETGCRGSSGHCGKISLSEDDREDGASAIRALDRPHRAKGGYSLKGEP